MSTDSKNNNAKKNKKPVIDNSEDLKDRITESIDAFKLRANLLMANIKEGGEDGGNLKGATRVGTLHDLRFVFLDDDTRVLFCTAYDGDWDPYIDDFATKIPELMDILFGNVEGWPGIKDPSVKQFILDHQITAAGWYVGVPHLTIQDIRRQDRIVKGINKALDEAQS